MSRIIHTDTYTNKSKIILTKLRDYMCRGWGSKQQFRNATYAKINVEPNGEVTWVVSDQPWDYRRTIYYKKQNDNDVRAWLAGMLKTMVFRTWLRTGVDTHQWNRQNNKLTLDCFNNDECDITVADIYCMYELLMNRKGFKRRWPTKFLKTIIGDGLDPIATELEVARREEAEKLWIKFQDECNRLSNEQYDEIQRSDEAIRNKYSKMKQDLEKAYKKDLAELNEQMKFCLDQAAG